MELMESMKDIAPETPVALIDTENVKAFFKKFNFGDFSEGKCVIFFVRETPLTKKFVSYLGNFGSPALIETRANMDFAIYETYKELSAKYPDLKIYSSSPMLGLVGGLALVPIDELSAFAIKEQS